MKVAGVEVTRRDFARIALPSSLPLINGIAPILQSHGVERAWWIVGVLGTVLLFLAIGTRLMVLRRRDAKADPAPSPPSTR